MYEGGGAVDHAVDLSRAVWRKSTRSNANGQCVEVAANLPGIVAVRDSKRPGAQGAVLVFSPSEWAAFVRGVKGGEFDLG